MEQAEPVHRLVEKARHGEHEAFSALVARFQGRLRPWVQARVALYLGPRLDVEEIVQETFARAFEALHRFRWRDDHADPFYVWLCGIARRVGLEYAQRSQRNQRLPTGHEVAARSDSPSTVLRRNERFDRLQASIRRLSPDYQEVIRLARIEGLTTREIAQRMQRSPNAVKHLLVRALRQLGVEFGDTGSLGLPPRQLFAEEGDDG
jgi:RNA polymerase sigma-70 factor (ECF subfamily)